MNLPPGYSAYTVLTSVDICNGWPNDFAHYLTLTEGQLLVLPNVHEVEALISGGIITPGWPVSGG